MRDANLLLRASRPHRSSQISNFKSPKGDRDSSHLVARRLASRELPQHGRGEILFDDVPNCFEFGRVSH